VGRQATALQLAARNGEGVLQQKLVEPGRLAQVALAGAGALAMPIRSRAAQVGGIVPQGLQLQFSCFDIARERNPGQGLTGLSEDVVRQSPIAVPRLWRQWLALAGQIVEVTPLLGFADLLLDGTFPVRQLFRRTARPR
jgi:hypothetical protein